MTVQPTLQCPRTMRFTQGEQVIISCSVTGDPTPNITWNKESQPGNVISYNSGLVIDNVRIIDGGLYTVTANNGRSATVLVELEIFCK